jgi:lantibiotic transport system ATP-binding protein
MEYTIETKHLDFSFGNSPILSDINLQVKKGEIFCFLGHNGAGKTTTIKLLLGLLQSKEDNISIFGKSIKKERSDVLKGIGSLIEQPSLYEHMTGKENLVNRAKLLQTPTSAIDEILEIIYLKDSANKKAGKYSLGMKQRLGIGLALLGDPDLLILDEPTNGLDPNGILAIRNLLKDLALNKGKTIFISSHLLSEVEKIATEVGIVNHGKLLYQGSISDLSKNQKSEIVIHCHNLPLALELLNAKHLEFHKTDREITIPFSNYEQMSELNKYLVANNVEVFELFHRKQDLEHLFLEMIKA